MTALRETEIVERFFSAMGACGRAAPGDDCALVAPPDGEKLLLSMDTSCPGRHFPDDTHPEDVGWRCLAVALSDLAACGGRADFCLLALTLPRADANWLEAFAAGFRKCSEAFAVRLVGGDLVKGQSAITVQVGGWVKEADFLARDGASPGDWLCVTGQLGAASAGLAAICGEIELPDPLSDLCRQAFLRPRPQLEAGQQLAGLASACMDISDGLALDLERMCRASNVGADLQAKAIPAIDAGNGDDDLQRALHGGDDYELCFTLPPDRAPQLHERLGPEGQDWHRIGQMSAQAGLRLDGQPLEPKGFDHFDEAS